MIISNFIKAYLIKLSLLIVSLLLSQIAFATSAGMITFIAGEATITHADKTVSAAIKSAQLNSGDTIETRDGRLQLSLIDGGKVSLQPNTIYKINKYEFSGKEDGSEYGFTELIKGGLRTVSGLIGHKNRDRYQLKTSVATIGIRGTEFTANFNDNQLLMTTNHGSVDVCNEGGCLNALTGQSIIVTGPGASPKPSDKAAKAAAAAPAAGKAVFASSDSITASGLPSVVATSLAANNILPALTNGPGTILSIAAEFCGCTLANDIRDVGLTFDGAGNVTDANGTSPFIDINPDVLTFSSFNNTDGIISWGQAAGGNYNKGGTTFTMARWDYIAGTTPNPTNLANLTGNYTVYGSTTPFLVSGGSNTLVGTANSVTGNFLFNFTLNTFAYNLSVPTATEVFNLVGSASSLNASNPNFQTGGTITSTGLSCSTGCSGALQGNKLIQGSFFGANGERVGVQYGIDAPGLNGAIYGGAVLK